MKTQNLILTFIVITLISSQCKKDKDPEPKEEKISFKVDTNLNGTYSGIFFYYNEDKSCFLSIGDTDLVRVNIKVDTSTGVIDFSEEYYAPFFKIWIRYEDKFIAKLVTKDSFRLEKRIRRGCGNYNPDTDKYDSYAEYTTFYGGKFRLINGKYSFFAKSKEEWCKYGLTCNTFNTEYTVIQD
jgi:hypothetical protein